MIEPLDAGLDRAALDVDYSARNTVSDAVFESCIARYTEQTAAARGLATALDAVFDPASGERVDVYGTVAAERRPAVLFIHGGYWRALGRKDSGFMAAGLAAQGVATAVPDYSLAPAVNLTEIVRQVRAAFAWLWHTAPELGIDRRRIVVCGSSAGGHLAGTLLSGGWQAGMGLPEDAVAAGLPISGLFELSPVARTLPNEWMRLSAEEIEQLSPLRRLPRRGCPVVVAVARNEAPGFHRQSRAYDAAWRAAGFRSELCVVPDRHHFDVVFDLDDPSTALGGCLARLVRGTGRGRAPSLGAQGPGPSGAR